MERDGRDDPGNRKHSLAAATQSCSLRNISKKFGAVSALTDIDLDVHAGEVVALVGDNGAGKSTLIKILAGVHLPTSGTIEFDGRQVALDNPATALNMGIATVFQDLALCENLDVVANLFLGHEMSPYRLDEVQMEVRAWTLLQGACGAYSLRARTDRIPFRRTAADGGDRPFVAAQSEDHHAR